METKSAFSRRHFVKTLAVAGAGVAAGLPQAAANTVLSGRKIKLGLDNFAVRALKLKAPQLIEYAARLRTDSLFISDLNAFESHEEASLRDLRRKAADQGLQIHVGTWSVCPTSRSFRADWGTAEEHLALGIRIAKAVGSPVIRVILGAREDRRTEGGIEARIADMVKVLKSQRSRAMDAGVKVAVENHAGDMQARELVELIEAAGKDYVGANLDSGNAAWTLEDPLASLEILGPYALTTSLRDSMVWETEAGAKVQWTAMGEGVVDFKTYFKRFAELCPGVPVHIETISGFAVEFPYLKEEIWSAFPKALAQDLARFVALAKRGREIPPHRAANEQADQEYQKGELERSLRYCREVIGLGLQA
jgi:3-oxoisoapionate decarboxylase